MSERPTWDEMKARADGGLLPRKEGAVAGLELLRADVRRQERRVASLREELDDLALKHARLEREWMTEQDALNEMRRQLQAASPEQPSAGRET